MFVQTEKSNPDNEQPIPLQGTSSSNIQNNPKQDEKDSEAIRQEFIEQLVAREAAKASRSDLRTLRSYLQDRFSVTSGDRKYYDWKLNLTDEECTILRFRTTRMVDQELENDHSELRTKIARRVIAQLPEHISEQDVVSYLEDPRAVSTEIRALMADQLIISPSERAIVQPITTELSNDESHYDTANLEMDELHPTPGENEIPIDRFQLLN